MKKRTQLVYGLLALVWVLIVFWQVIEHRRVVASAKTELRNTARDVTTTLGIVMRSQRRFGIISRERLESALNELIQAGVAKSVALLNAAGEVVASAGPEIEAISKGFFIRQGGWEYWGKNEVSIQNLVDLGTSLQSEREVYQATIVVPVERLFPPRDTNTPEVRMPPPQLPNNPGVYPGIPPGPPPGDSNVQLQPPPPSVAPVPPPSAPEARPFRPESQQARHGRFPRPFWISEKEYQELVKKQGVHAIVVALPTEYVRAKRANIKSDLLARLITTFFATVAVVGLAVGWRAQVRASELELRLVRAAEQAATLKEMNLAAIGLAHETKNPLNVIRGQCQLIAMNPAVPEEVRQVAARVVEQADRIAAQLNEFINFSKPREIRKAIVNVQNVIDEVLRALAFDIEDKRANVKVIADVSRIEADEQLLRQVLFNLVLNSIQAISENGNVEIVVQRVPNNDVVLEVRDDGPGVPPQYKDEIFKPYFTTHQKGTGLGLAIVKQIVLAHGWEIEYLPNNPKGAIFRISHVRGM